MDYRTTEVYKLFLALERYALGDLNIFHRLAAEAELADAELEQKDPDRPRSTMYPYGFEFNFGKAENCRATIPFALAIFSCMDILGFLLKGGDHRKTEKNIKEFYQKVTRPPSAEEIDCLVRLFRHGLAHNYFPKLGQSISYRSTNPETLFFRAPHGICLNVKMLEAHFLEVFYIIRDDVDMYAKMEQHFNQLNNHYEEHEKCKLLSLL